MTCRRSRSDQLLLHKILLTWNNLNLCSKRDTLLHLHAENPPRDQRSTAHDSAITRGDLSFYFPTFVFAFYIRLCSEATLAGNKILCLCVMCSVIRCF